MSKIKTFPTEENKEIKVLFQCAVCDHEIFEDDDDPVAVMPFIVCPKCKVPQMTEAIYEEILKQVKTAKSGIIVPGQEGGPNI
ncbi:MAG: hypothetical protein QF864_04290 [SAR202 cluster bacterium]|jgi:peptide subunit release factor 1 (eRF1)|nr:hypothetical protein [SAR202 cluster bacterium]